MEEASSIAELQELVGEFTGERGWEKAHNPKNLSMSIAIEAAELMEIFQWKSSEASLNIADPVLVENIADELADVLIYCLSMANQFNFNAYDIVRKKMQKNSLKYPA